MKKIFQKITTLVAGGVLMGAALFGCSRDAAFKDAPSNVSFSEPASYSLPASASYAEKRKFADFTGDGVEDMAEVNDTAFWGQDYKATIYPGKNVNGILQFSEEDKYTVDLPLDKSWMSDQTKIDSAEVNGDGYADFVFTEYKKGWRTDRYHIKVAMNQKDGTFKFTDVKVSDKLYQATGSKELGDLVTVMTAKRRAKFSYSDDKNLSNYFNMDWADVDGNGQDDLMMFWDYRRNLYVDVLLTGKAPGNPSEVCFVDRYGAEVQDFMMNRNIKYLDTEDFTGDNIADLIIYRRSGSNVILSVAIGEINNGMLRYIVQKDVKGKGADLDFFAFEKNDSFDGNFDGKADYVHVGKKDGKPTIVYKFTKVKK